MDKNLKKIKGYAFQFARVGTVVGCVLSLIFISLTWNYEQSNLNDKRRELTLELKKEAFLLNKKFNKLENLADTIKQKLDHSDFQMVSGYSNLENSFRALFPLPEYLFGIGMGMGFGSPQVDGNAFFSTYWHHTLKKSLIDSAGSIVSITLLSTDSLLSDAYISYPKLYDSSLLLKGWQAPHFDSISNSWLIRYHLPFRVNSSHPATIYLDFKQSEFKTVNLRSNGQGYIATKEGMIIYSEKMMFNTSHLPSLHQISETQKDGGDLYNFLHDKLLDPLEKLGVMQYEDKTQKGGPEWRIFSKLASTHLTLVRIYKQEDVRMYWKKLLRWRFYLIASLLVFFIGLLYWMLNDFRKVTVWLANYGWAKNTWVFSNVTTGILTLGLIASLMVVNNLSDKIDYEQENEISSRITNYLGTAKYINNKLKVITLKDVDFLKLSVNGKRTVVDEDSLRVLLKGDSALRDADSLKFLPSVKPESKSIPTATNGYTKDIPQITLNINSLDLIESNYVQLTGEISVKYPNPKKFDDISKDEAPFFFPDAVEQEIRFLQKTEQRIPSKVDPAQNDTLYKVSDWYFSCKLYQKFDFAYYPFDNKQVKLRIQHVNRDTKFFIPDFDNYYKKANHLVLAQIKNAKQIKDDLITIHKAKEQQPVLKKVWVFLGAEDSLNLPIINPQDSVLAKFENIRIVEWEFINGRFNIDKTNILWNGNSKRQVTTPELVYVVQLKRLMQEPIISNFLPFMVIAIIVFIVILQMKNLGMDHVIGTMIALFFSLLLAHFKLREDLHFHSLVYIEYFYFLLYVVIIICVINKYLYLSDDPHEAIAYKKNMIAKVTYWPILLTMMILGTMFFFVYF